LRWFWSFVVTFWQGEMKRRAMPGLGLDRDTAAVSLDDLFADGQPDACTLEFLAAMQSLKHAEDPFEVLGLDAEPIVSNGEHPLRLALSGGRYVYPGNPWALVFDRVPDQILEELNQLALVGHDARQGIVCY